jgi:polysaccharide biosynthesis protein PelE
MNRSLDIHTSGSRAFPAGSGRRESRAFVSSRAGAKRASLSEFAALLIGQSRSSRLPLAILSVAVLLEVALVLGLLNASIPVALVLGFHFYLVAALLLVLGYKARIAKSYALPDVLFVLCVSFLGPLCALGLFLLALPRSKLGPAEQHLDDRFVDLFPVQNSTAAKVLSERLLQTSNMASGHDTLASFSDVFRNGKLVDKQSVITLILNHFEPAFAPMLRGALSDADPAVRIQAATAISRLETTALEKSIVLQAKLKGEPLRADLVLALGRHYDDYANSGLLDAERAELVRGEALELYRRCIELGDESEETLTAVLRILIRMNRPKDAITAFHCLEEQGEVTAQAVSWQAEALFKLGHFEALHALSERYQIQGPVNTDSKSTDSKSTGVSERCQQSLALWAGTRAST